VLAEFVIAFGAVGDELTKPNVVAAFNEGKAVGFVCSRHEEVAVYFFEDAGEVWREWDGSGPHPFELEVGAVLDGECYDSWGVRFDKPRGFGGSKLGVAKADAADEEVAQPEIWVGVFELRGGRYHGGVVFAGDACPILLWNGKCGDGEEACEVWQFEGCVFLGHELASEDVAGVFVGGVDGYVYLLAEAAIEDAAALFAFHPGLCEVAGKDSGRQ
jgi:hypothetical protein